MLTIFPRFSLVLIALPGLAACNTLGSSSTPSSPPYVPRGAAIVTGGIRPCEGLPNPRAPQYAAGTVTVLKGRITMKRTGPGTFREVLPTQAVETATVASNATYRFVLAPGRYVLKARFPPPANVAPFTAVTLKPGRHVHVDIPNMCL